MNLQEKEVIQFVSEFWENEQEYGGRMETWCFFCTKYQGEKYQSGGDGTHEKGCIHLTAVILVEREQ